MYESKINKIKRDEHRKRKCHTDQHFYYRVEATWFGCIQPIFSRIIEIAVLLPIRHHYASKDQLDANTVAQCRYGGKQRMTKTGISSFE